MKNNKFSKALSIFLIFVAVFFQFCVKETGTPIASDEMDLRSKVTKDHVFGQSIT